MWTPVAAMCPPRSRTCRPICHDPIWSCSILPRAGAHAKVCRQIAQAGAKDVIYVACDPTSLARDTATLISLGYRLSDIRAYDIYPMTHHVETVAWFTRIGR